jgi:SAM-dependent methyltransferase
MENCIICNSKKLIKIPGKIVPFLMHRMKIEGTDKTDLNKCANCNFFFYSYRPSDQQMKDYYFDYWGESYQKDREAFEPYYNKEFCNVIISEDISNINFSESEKLRLLNTLKELKIDMNKIESLLDYGGHNGKNINIPEFQNLKKYVYDISGEEVLENITNVTNFSSEELKEKYDLIICQHLLEHVSYPLNEMKNIFHMLKKGGYFYFEMPQGNRADALFNVKRNLMSYLFSWYRKYLKKLFFKKNDFYIMHEHINYFNKKSVKALCKNSGLKFIKSFESQLELKTADNKSNWKSKIIYGMAKKIS